MYKKFQIYFLDRVCSYQQVLYVNAGPCSRFSSSKSLSSIVRYESDGQKEAIIPEGQTVNILFVNYGNEQLTLFSGIKRFHNSRSFQKLIKAINLKKIIFFKGLINSKNYSQFIV